MHMLNLSGLPGVMKVVIKTVNFILSKGINHWKKREWGNFGKRQGKGNGRTNFIMNIATIKEATICQPC